MATKPALKINSFSVVFDQCSFLVFFKNFHVSGEIHCIYNFFFTHTSHQFIKTKQKKDVPGKVLYTILVVTFASKAQM